MKASNNLFFWISCLAVTSLLSSCNKSSTQDTPSTPTPVMQGQNSGHGDGGIDSGGGNFVGSDTEQIKAIFRGDNGFNLKETVKSVFKSVEFQVTNKSLSQEAESIFSRMLGSNFSGDSFDIYQDIDKSPYDLKESGPCLESQLHSGSAGHSKDASTKINQKEATICFSLDGLKQLPIQAVPFQIVALAIHEHAHHYGFNESDSVLAQKEALKVLNFGLLNGIYMETVSYAASLRDSTSRLLENLNSGFSDKLICKHLAGLSSTTYRLVEQSIKIKQQFEVRMLITALDHSFPVNTESLKGAEDANSLTKGLLCFCGEDKTVTPSWGERVPEGDRKKLKIQLNALYEKSQQIVLQALSSSRRSLNSK